MSVTERCEENEYAEATGSEYECCLHEVCPDGEQVCCWCGLVYAPRYASDPHIEHGPNRPGAAKRKRAKAVGK